MVALFLDALQEIKDYVKEHEAEQKTDINRMIIDDGIVGLQQYEKRSLIHFRSSIDDLFYSWWIN